MPLYDPFDAFGYSAGDTSFEDTISWETTTIQPSADFTSGVLRSIPESQGGQKGFFQGLFGSAKSALGFADNALDLIDGLDLKARRVTGEGFLPDNRLTHAGALSVPGLGQVSPLVLAAGVGVVVYLATR